MKMWATPRVSMSNAPFGGGDPSKKLFPLRLENQVQLSFRAKAEGAPADAPPPSSGQNEALHAAVCMTLTDRAAQ